MKSPFCTRRKAICLMFGSVSLVAASVIIDLHDDGDDDEGCHQNPKIISVHIKSVLCLSHWQ